jgi:hypothetical protein
LEWLLQGGNAQYSISQNGGEAKPLRLKRIFFDASTARKKTEVRIRNRKGEIVPRRSNRAARPEGAAFLVRDLQAGWVRRLAETPEKPLSTLRVGSGGCYFAAGDTSVGFTPIIGER